MKLQVECRKSEKSGATFLCIVLVRGDKKTILSVDRDLIAKILDFRPSEMSNIALGEVIEVK